jgi:hypothetical protein
VCTRAGRALPPGQLARDNQNWRENLCRDLCRNPSIPARIGPSHVVSLGIKRVAATSDQTRMNTAPLCYSDFFGVAWSRTGLRFDTVEVWGSSPHVPTISFYTV